MFYHLIDSPMTIAAIPLDPTGIQHSALVCTQHRCETTVKARAEIQLWKHQAKQFRIISSNILYIYILQYNYIQCNSQQLPLPTSLTIVRLLRVFPGCLDKGWTTAAAKGCKVSPQHLVEEVP
jgi:hypothetical protein